VFREPGNQWLMCEDVVSYISISFNGGSKKPSKNNSKPQLIPTKEGKRKE
jgi:hypothetical protein